MIKKNKKASITLQGSFLYDLVFSLILIVILFSFLSTVDSGLYYWREYYSQDLSSTLSLIEGVSEDISINYVVLHDKNIITSNPVELMLEIYDGIIFVYNRHDYSYKTEKNFVTKEDSNLRLVAPLEALTISKNKDGKVDLQSKASTSCSLFNINKKELINTSFLIIKPDQFILFRDIKAEVYSGIKQKYMYQLSSGGIITELRNKLIINNLPNANSNDIVVLFEFKEANTKSINIKYSAKGNPNLANNFACNLLGYLEEEYENSLVIGREKLPIYMDNVASANINHYNNQNAAVILIEFNANSFSDFAIVPNTFARLLNYALYDVTSSADEETIQKLLVEYNIENE